MHRKSGFIILAISTVLMLTLAAILGMGILYSHLNTEMEDRMEKRQILLPTIYFGASKEWKKNQQVNRDELQNELSLLRKREISDSLLIGDYGLFSGSQCQIFVTPETTLEETDQCLVVHWNQLEHPGFEVEQIKTLIFDKAGGVVGVFSKSLSGSVHEALDFKFPPQIVAQYLGEDPFLLESQPLNVYPVACLNAIMAIEDAHFLEHKGVSITGILRAFVKNIVLGRKAQGGSTITQQMVKNFFLTPEKTMLRKVKEILMALILETKSNKDLILENYLNIIYMGQKGSYQVRGYGAASAYYFGKKVQDLETHECALLAAIVNSPGLYSPFTHGTKSMERRNLVLNKMAELNFLSSGEKEAALSQPLPTNRNSDIYSTLPYFIQAVQKQMNQEGFPNLEGMKIYTTLDVKAQEVAQEAIEKHLAFLENNQLKNSKKKLESVLVSADVDTGFVRALVGGRSYKITQFNRVLNSQRQLGSTFKPFVYLTALMTKDQQGQKYNPLSLLKDEPFVYNYDNQKWEPLNYNKKSQGNVPFFYALKESLNLPTAKLALDIGIENIIDVAKELGIVSDIDKVPSVSLGGFGLNPLQLLQAYLNLARLGKMTNLTFVQRVLNLQGDSMWEFKPFQKDFRDLESVQLLVGIMKETVRSGTAHSLWDKGFTRPASGKTGTTNDNKDTWFAGFTPLRVAIVWTGFDDATTTGLTGASGAVPIWLQYMNSVVKNDPEVDFLWSPTLKSKKISLQEIQDKEMLLTVESQSFKEPELIFKADE